MASLTFAMSLILSNFTLVLAFLSCCNSVFVSGHPSLTHSVYDSAFSFVAHATNATEDSITADLNARALPMPWPLGILSIVVSVLSGLENYMFFTSPPPITFKTRIGWGLSLARAFGFGITAMCNMREGIYAGVSSDGFLALFNNIAAIMDAGQDYGQRLWAAGGALAMAIGLFPRLIQISLSYFRGERSADYAPFIFTNGTQCIVDPKAICSPQNQDVPGCAAPVELGSPLIPTTVDYLRAAAWLFAILLVLPSIIRICSPGKSMRFGRNKRVFLAYITLGFSVALVVLGAIVYGKTHTVEGLDCRTITSCIAGQPLTCPPIHVLTPSSSNGFVKEWAETIKGVDALGLLT